MAKKTQKPTAPQQTKTKGLENLGTVVAAAKRLDTEVDVEVLEEIKEQKDTIPEEVAPDFESLLKAFETAVKSIYESERIIKNNEQLSKSALEKAEQNRIDEIAKREAADKALDEAKKEKSHWEAQNKKLAEKASELTELERDLFEREQNAELGFAKQNKESLKQLADEKELIEEELAELREEKKSFEKNFKTEKQNSKDAWEDEFEKFKNEQEQALESILETRKINFNTSLENDKSRIAEQKEELAKKIADFETEKAAFDIELNSLRSSKSAIEATVKSQVEQRCAEIISENNRLKEERIPSLIEQLNAARKEIDNFSDLNTILRGESPESILTLNRILKQENADLKQKLNATPGEDLQEDFEELEEKYEVLETTLQEKEREISKLKSDLSKKNFYISEQEFSKKKLEAEALHSEMYAEKVNQMKIELDGLKEKDKEKQTFKALTAYDNAYNRSESVYGKDSEQTLADFVEAVRHKMAAEEFYYPLKTLQLFVAGLAMSRLHILQGISGTGKTSLATKFAKVVNGVDSNNREKGIQTVAVQAGWRDGQDLIGYFNAFENRYYETDFLKGLYQAQTPAFKDKPYIILLDEMNLSHPEQYFANFLSALELSEDSRIVSLTSSAMPNAPKELIEGCKIKIPSNVWFIGTANHDETTMEFADKTYDRSHVMELPRHKSEEFQPDATKNCNWTFENLHAAFVEAESNYKAEVNKVHEFLEEVAELYLEPLFDVGFGNRLKRQLDSFVPVLIESGGTIEMAIDHILSTKLLRKGKVIGRFDTTPHQIKSLKEGILELWRNAKLRDNASESLELLEKEYYKKAGISK